MRFKQYQTAPTARESGQTVVMFVFFLAVLILFLGMAIDLGFAYITKAQLSKAVDAACLSGMVNLSQGTTQAEAMARSTFYINYTITNQDSGPVTPTASITTDGCQPSPNQNIMVSATASMNTYFIRYLAPWKTLPVGDTATATRQHLIVCLVLDRSGSMNPITGTTFGGKYLPGAVTDFIGNFEENYDQAGMVSFATIPTTDFPIASVFKTQISTAGSNLNYVGGTFSIGGLILGSNQVAAVTTQACEYAVKAIVFFTDGHANMIDQSLNCPPQSPWLIGGFDAASGNAVAFWPTNTTLGNQDNYSCYLNNGGNPSCCGGQNYFVASDGSHQPFLRPNVTAEAETEGVALAKSMQQNGWFVYCVGLSASASDPVNATFLNELANTTNSPSFDSTLPQGSALIATDPSQLDSLFNEIAQQILLRLTQ